MIPIDRQVWKLAGLFFLLCLVLGGCKSEDQNAFAAANASRIIVILPGSIKDKSWNKTNYDGIIACRDTLMPDLEYVEEVPESDFEAVFTEYASLGYGLVIGAGSQFDEAAATVAPKYPQTRFCVINGIFCDGENLSPVFLKEYEASYLASIIAGNITQTGILGVIVGFPNIPMENLLQVYEKNALELARSRGISSPQVLRSYTNSWEDVVLGEKITIQMIDSGVDVLFVYANEVGLGSLKAARGSGTKVIGFSANQNEGEEGTVAASIDFDFGSLYTWIIRRFQSGGLTGNQVHEVGIRENIFVPVYSQEITQEIRDAVDTGITDVLEGKVNWFYHE